MFIIKTSIHVNATPGPAGRHLYNKAATTAQSKARRADIILSPMFKNAINVATCEENMSGLRPFAFRDLPICYKDFSATRLICDTINIEKYKM